VKVIFLDIDGVLNNHEGLGKYGIHYIDADKVNLLKSIVFVTKADIVLSSTWRIKHQDYIMVQSVLLSHGMVIYDVTPQTFGGHRGHEIGQWLSSHSGSAIDKYAILDDDPDAGISRENSFFQTHINTGLTVRIAEKLIKHLNA